MSGAHPPAVALLPWGNVIEDFLDTLGVSLEAFSQEFTGSWMFGYVDALQRAGVRTVLICVSARVTRPSRVVHRPTGAPVWILPVPRCYRALRRRMVNPYGLSTSQVFGGAAAGWRRALRPLLAVSRNVALYSTTPLRLVARTLRHERCAAMLCQEYEFPRFDVCVLLGRVMRVPVFATFQGGNYQRSSIERYIRRLAVRGCTGLIIGTERERRRLRDCYGVPAHKLARIFNPIDLEFWNALDRTRARRVLGIPLDAEVVVWHGRVSIQQKGLDVLLRAWQHVRRPRAGRDLRMVLVGSGKDAARLRALIAPTAGVTWVDQFLHDRQTIRLHLSAADIYAFPSRHEGFPVSPLEAMACGLPVVAADALGMADILEGGEASGGIVVPSEDAEAFAAALGRLLDDREWSRELGRRARRRVEAHFSLETVGRELRRFLFADRPSSANGIDVVGGASAPSSPLPPMPAPR